MTEEELAAIGALLPRVDVAQRQAIIKLLAEVDRLRAELENVDEAIRSNRVLELEYRHEIDTLILKQSAQVAAMRPIVEAVAAEAIDEHMVVERCMYCGYYFTGWPIPHAPDCPVTQARMLLAKDGDA
jgi:hypothetical protein